MDRNFIQRRLSGRGTRSECDLLWSAVFFCTRQTRAQDGYGDLRKLPCRPRTQLPRCVRSGWRWSVAYTCIYIYICPKNKKTNPSRKWRVSDSVSKKRVGRRKTLGSYSQRSYRTLARCRGTRENGAFSFRANAENVASKPTHAVGVFGGMLPRETHGRIVFGINLSGISQNGERLITQVGGKRREYQEDYWKTVMLCKSKTLDNSRWFAFLFGGFFFN